MERREYDRTGTGLEVEIAALVGSLVMMFNIISVAVLAFLAAFAAWWLISHFSLEVRYPDRLQQ